MSGAPGGEREAAQGEAVQGEAVQGEAVQGEAVQGEEALTVRLQGFAREALEQESTRLNVPVEDLVGFAVLYYLADVDSGRIARRITGGAYPVDPP